MIWSKLVWWVTWRGLVSGAILGALFGVFILFIYGAIIGFVLGGIIGSALGFIDGILLTFVTGFLYSPPNTKSIYPSVAYIVSILINTVPFFVILGGLMLSWAVMPLSLGQSITSVLCSGGIPALLSGIATAYFCGGYLEYADSLLKDIPSRNPPVNVLS